MAVIKKERNVKKIFLDLILKVATTVDPSQTRSLQKAE